jgi:hypothetical protein
VILRKQIPQIFSTQVHILQHFKWQTCLIGCTTWVSVWCNFIFPKKGCWILAGIYGIFFWKNFWEYLLTLSDLNFWCVHKFKIGVCVWCGMGEGTFQSDVFLRQHLNTMNFFLLLVFSISIWKIPCYYFCSIATRVSRVMKGKNLEIRNEKEDHLKPTSTSGSFFLVSRFFPTNI